jgi:hypothetical protein
LSQQQFIKEQVKGKKQKEKLSVLRQATIGGKTIIKLNSSSSRVH